MCFSERVIVGKCNYEKVPRHFKRESLLKRHFQLTYKIIFFGSSCYDGHPAPRDQPEWCHVYMA